MYGWIITKDHLYDNGTTSDYDHDRAGTMGPSGLPDHLRKVLEEDSQTVPRHLFRMYDDDGILYYTGYGAWDPDDEGDENALVGPLRDFGTPNAGAVLIKWHGRPEWTCEWC